MAGHKAVEIDPQELKKAQRMWDRFADGLKYSVIATAIVLIGLALAFVKFS